MRIFYLRDETNFPTACVATEKEDDGQIRFAVSTWNPVDEFSRSMARRIAIGRLDAKNRGWSINGPPYDYALTCSFNVKARIVLTIAENDHLLYPQRTVKAAILWLVNKCFLPAHVGTWLKPTYYNRKKAEIDVLLRNLG